MANPRVRFAKSEDNPLIKKDPKVQNLIWPELLFVKGRVARLDLPQSLGGRPRHLGRRG